MKITKLNRPIIDLGEPSVSSGGAALLDGLNDEPLSQAESDALDRAFHQSAVAQAIEDAELLRQKGYVTFSLDPSWEHPLEWIDCLLGISEIHQQTPPPPTARSLTIRLSIIGGGELKLTAETRVVRFGDGVRESVGSIRIDAEGSSGVIQVSYTEMEAVTIGLATSDAGLAERIAKTVATPDPCNLAETLCPILAPSKRCLLCSRKLEDDVSKVLQIGPTCASRLGLAHNPQAAEIVLQKRHELLNDKRPAVSK